MLDVRTKQSIEWWWWARI